MTIKDIETSSGIPRANIRFYESQGLISPARSENGYRDYSEADLEMLLRIKLLRSLEVSIDEIKSLISGERELTPILQEQLENLRERQNSLTRSSELCRMMLDDHAAFDSLDARRYLEADRDRAQLQSVLSSDRMPPVPHPFRRLFARGIDTGLYKLIIHIVLTFLGVNFARLSTGSELLVSLAVLAMTIVLEPLLLSRFGTTPGKWLLGLSITGIDGEKPSYDVCFYRFLYIIRYAYGLYIPIYNIYRMWKSMIACLDCEELPWESETVMVIRDTRHWRIAAWAGSWAAIVGATLLLGLSSAMPQNTGVLTPAEFAENFNSYTEFYSDSVLRMDEKGGWYTDDYVSGGTTVVVVTGHSAGEPKVEFVADADGNISSVSFTKLITSPDDWPSAYTDTLALAALSFVRAQPGAHFLAPKLDDFLEFLDQHPLEDFECELYGVRLKCNYEYSGYLSTSIGLWPDEDAEEHFFSMNFTMSLE